MSPGRRILVPLDGSDLAERALPLATAVARHDKGVLHLLDVCHPWVGTDLPPSPVLADICQASRDRAATYLEGVAAPLREAGYMVETELRSGRAEAEILSACRETRSDMIVMATHGRGGFARLWLGSVADRVIRRASVPVLLVSAAGDPDADARRTAVPLESAPRSVRTIIIPLDGSSVADQALVPATAVGEAFGADYVLIQVVPGPAVLTTAPFQAVASWNNSVELEKAAARRRMEEIAAEMRAAGYRVTVVVSEEDEPVRAILRLVASTPDSLLAMATHGRGGLRRALIGSIADKLVRANRRPMLVVRPPGKHRRTERFSHAEERTSVHTVIGDAAHRRPASVRQR